MARKHLYSDIDVTSLNGDGFALTFARRGAYLQFLLDVAAWWTEESK